MRIPILTIILCNLTVTIGDNRHTMRITHILNLLIIVVFMTLNVQSVVAQSTEKPFYFEILSANDTYNSKSELFKRRYSGGERSYHIQLTTSELKRIRELLKQSNFRRFPEEFKPKTDRLREVIPSFRYILETNYEGIPKSVTYNDRITDSLMREEAKPYLKLYRAIWETIYSNPEVKKLRASDIFYE